MGFFTVKQSINFAMLSLQSSIALIKHFSSFYGAHMACLLSFESQHRIGFVSRTRHSFLKKMLAGTISLHDASIQ
jgi:hypothetical protein